MFKTIDVLANWQILHVPLTKDLCEKYGDSTFDRFLEEFKKYEGWEWNGDDIVIKKKWNTVCSVSQSIITFEGKAMLLNFKEYGKFLFWYREQKEKKHSVVWQ